MFKKIFMAGILSGILASIAGIIYNRIYFFATQADFSAVLNTRSIIGLNMFICLAASIKLWVFTKWFGVGKAERFFNLLFSILSFGAVMIPISINLPLKVSFPELFPGLAVPMVFFPAMAWYTVRPWWSLVANSQ